MYFCGHRHVVDLDFNGVAFQITADRRRNSERERGTDA